MMKLFTQRVYFILAIGIFFLAFFLRFYMLGEIPGGLYPDETAIGYNAYSILQTGKDEHGESFPLYFKSFDDFKMPVYIYGTAGVIEAFGVNAFSVRLLSAVFGMLSVVVIFFLARLLFNNKLVAASIAFLLAVNPWHVFFSRTGYEVNVATSLLVLGVLFFVWAVRRKNSMYLFILAEIAFILSVYTYNVTRLIAPLLFIALIFLFRHELKTLSTSRRVSLLMIFFIGLVPFLVSFVTLQSEDGFSSQKDALIIGNAVRADIIETRSYFLDLPPLLQKMFFNYWVLVFWAYIKNLVAFFSTSFFFIVGASKPSQNIGGGIAMFYYFEFPLILLGVYHAFRHRVKALNPFIAWFLVVFIFGSIIHEVPNGTRTYAVVIPFVVFSGYGLFVLSQYLRAFPHVFLRYAMLCIIFGFITYSVIFYLLSYFFRFPIEHAIDWQTKDYELVSFLREHEDNYNEIIFDESAEFPYTSLLFYGEYDPETYHTKAIYEPDGLVVTLREVEKYRFRKIKWTQELARPGNLVITSEDFVPEGKEPIATFSYPTRPVVIYFDRQIGQYPVTKTAYKVFETN